VPCLSVFLAFDRSVSFAPMSNDFSLGEVHVSSSPQERFEEYLQSRGKRITQQRRALVDYIFERHDHFDADELIDSLGRRDDGDKISRPTVYRTLAELVDAGITADDCCSAVFARSSKFLMSIPINAAGTMPK